MGRKREKIRNEEKMKECRENKKEKRLKRKEEKKATVENQIKRKRK